MSGRAATTVRSDVSVAGMTRDLRRLDVDHVPAPTPETLIRTSEGSQAKFESPTASSARHCAASSALSCTMSCSND